MRTLLLILCLLLSGCAITDNLATYDAAISTPSGGQYTVHNKHGSLLVVEEVDGTKITADDRGLPQAQGTFDKLIDFATVQAAGKVGE